MKQKNPLHSLNEVSEIGDPSPHSSDGRALDLKTRGCGLDSPASKP